MKKTLYIITGAPASGKLTASRKVENEKTRLFHNHLTIDLVLSIFPFVSEPYIALCEKLREDCIESAFKNGIESLIFTLCYEGSVDEPFLNNLEKIAESLSVRIKYIHLNCERNKLIERVSNKERTKFGKITSKDKLVSILDSWACESPIPKKESIIINNTHLTSEESAEKLKEVISS